MDWKPVVPWILTAAGLGVGIWQYADKATKANREPFLKQQTELAIETSEVVATLATTADVETYEKARNRFWVLYWGPLAYVEDKAVERAMVQLGPVIGEPGSPVPPLPQSTLQKSSLDLAYLLRGFVLANWGVDAGNLNTRDVTQ